ncbi:MAG: DUF362 domain-containing protein [Bacteroidota bacterium]|nr:DUF362 domain-containing protein [Bacteroidota bacterium]
MTDHEKISRREFLVRGGKAAALAAACTGAGFALHVSEKFPFDSHDDKALVRDLRIPGIERRMVLARGESPVRITRAVIERLGGMKVFIQPGDVVVVKPNIGWDRTAEQAANTNPDVVAEIVRLCLAAGAIRVIVADITCNETERCYQRSGIAEAATAAGAIVERPVEAGFRSVNMGGAMLGTQLVYRTFLEADKVINVPIVKHHSLTGATLGLKNLYGILGGNRSRLHQDVHDSLADLGNFLRPTLTVMDAYRVLRRNGPQGGNLADVEICRTVIASTDPVAVDAFAAEKWFGLTEEQLPYLRLAEKYGLGSASYREIPMNELTD